MEGTKVTDLIKINKNHNSDIMDSDTRDLIKEKVYNNRTFFNGNNKVYGTLLYLELSDNTDYDAGTLLMNSEIYQNDFSITDTKDGIEVNMLEDPVLYIDLDLEESKVYIDNYTELEDGTPSICNDDRRLDVAIKITANNEENKFDLNIVNTAEITDVDAKTKDTTLTTISSEDDVAVALDRTIGESDLVIERIDGVYIVIIFPNVNTPAYIRVYDKDLSDDEDEEFISNVEDTNALFNNFRGLYKIKKEVKHTENYNDIAIGRWDNNFNTLIQTLKNENVVLDDNGDVISYTNAYGLTSTTSAIKEEDGSTIITDIVGINDNILSKTDIKYDNEGNMVSIKAGDSIKIHDYDAEYDSCSIPDNILSAYNEYVTEYVTDHVHKYYNTEELYKDILPVFYFNEDYPNVWKYKVFLTNYDHNENIDRLIAYGYIFDKNIYIEFNMIDKAIDKNSDGFARTVSYLIDTENGLELYTAEYNKFTNLLDNKFSIITTSSTFKNTYGAQSEVTNTYYTTNNAIVGKGITLYNSNELSLTVNYSLETGLVDSKTVKSDIYNADDNVFYFRDIWGVPRKYELK